MPQSSHFSALSSWVLLLAKAIDSYGLDSRKLFAEAGMDHARLRDPLARFSTVSLPRLWRLAFEATQDPCLGLTVARFWHPTTMYALGYSWLASVNLAEAFDCMRRYTRMVNTAAQGVINTENTDGSYRVVIDTKKFNPPPHDASVDAVLGMLVIMCRSTYGESFRLQRVTIRHDRPLATRGFEEFFDAPVEFSQTENALWMDASMVLEPLATANPELVRVNNRIVTNYLAQIDRNDLGMRVRSQLIEHLPGGHANEAEIAAMLNVSQRSLQRKLKEQGISFTQLVENTRRELGLQYVRDPQHSFNEIAFLLGFTEPANFSRAFKRWYGKTPTEYRQMSLS
jgi:AraC-like DNA-binding protein